MRDLLPQIDLWLRDRKPVAVATVVQTWGSSPRGVGSKMVFTPSGEVAGSVSGGCVEAAVITSGLEVLKDRPPQLLHFGVSDETAWEVGLTCGGSLDVFVSRLEESIYAPLRGSVDAAESVALVTAVRGPAEILGHQLLVWPNGRSVGSLGARLDAAAVVYAHEALDAGASGRHTMQPDTELLVEIFLPPITVVMVGGVHIATALVPLAKTLGWRTVLIDPRKTWANVQRFAEADQLVTSWPDDAFKDLTIDRTTAVVTLTHDPKIDDPALQAALASPAFYVAALGSRSSQAKRRQRLLDAGMSDSELSRLHAPAGLDIGARTPQEIAVSIAAEIVSAHRARGQGRNAARFGVPDAEPVAQGASA